MIDHNLQNSTSARQLLLEAVHLHKQGQWQAAYNIYQQVLELDQRNADALHLTGLILFQVNKDLTKAERYIRQALVNKPDFAEAHNNLGSVLREQAKLVEAIDEFTKALKLKPDYAEASFNLGLCLHQLGRFTESLKHLHLVLTLQPKRSQLRLLMGQALRAIDKDGEARTHLKAIDSSSSDWAQAQTELGLLHLKAGKTPEAKRAFQRAVAKSPTQALARYHLAMMEERTEGGTEQLLYELVTEHPDFIDGWLALIPLEIERSQFAQARTHAEQAILAMPRAAELRALRAQALRGLNLYEEAIAQYAELIETNSKNADYRRAIIELLTETRNWSLAADHCLALHLQEPHIKAVRLSLGKLLNEAYRFTEARIVMDQYVADHPNDVEALLLLGHICKEHKEQLDQATAEQCFSRALELEPNNRDVLNGLAMLRREQSRFLEARDLLQRGIDLNPQWAEGVNNLAGIYKSEGRWEDALATYQEALRIQPDFAGVYSNICNLFRERNDNVSALEAVLKGISINPQQAENRVNAALCQLGLGLFEEGWKNYEWRFRGRERRDYPMAPKPDNHSIKLPSQLLPIAYEGKRVALLKDQGLGDELFFLRFAPVLKSLGATVIYVPDHRIQPLIEKLGIIDEFTHDGGQVPMVDYVFAVGDLPLVLQMVDTTPPPPSLPLTVAKYAAETIEAKLGTLGLNSKRLLGVTWRGGAEIRRNGSLSKEIELDALATALREHPASVLVLQRNPKDEEIERFSSVLGRPVFDLSAFNSDLSLMLALLDRLDDYVGVSNTNMHLRLGLGKTAKVLVPMPADFRWMSQGTESPWFPGFKVYRERYPDGWTSALANLEKDLNLSVAPMLNTN